MVHTNFRNAHANVGHPVYDYSTALVRRVIRCGERRSLAPPCGELVESAAVPLSIFIDTRTLIKV